MSRAVCLMITFTTGVAIAHLSHSPTATPTFSTATSSASGKAAIVAQANDDSEPKNLSPYEISNFIIDNPRSDLSKLGERLGIEKADASRYPTWQCGNCEAEVYEHDLDGDLSNEVVLKVSDESTQICRFLIFAVIDGRADQWRLLGHIDHEMNKYRMAQHIIFLSGGRSWLVLRGQGSSGSGVSSYFDRVFIVGRGGVREVLSYECEGFQGGLFPQPTREFSGHLVSLALEKGVVLAEIRFAVQYWTDNPAAAGEDLLLLAKTQRAVFSRPLGSGKQMLETHRSDLTQRELDAVYNIDSLINKEFLKYNDAELSAMAKGRDGNKKEWLRQFLDECDECDQSGVQRRLRQHLK